MHFHYQVSCCLSPETESKTKFNTEKKSTRKIPSNDVRPLATVKKEKIVHCFQTNVCICDGETNKNTRLLEAMRASGYLQIGNLEESQFFVTAIKFVFD